MDIEKIGKRIKYARDMRNLTLDDIASDIGVAKSTVQRYEKGLISNPKLPVLQAIANSLNVNPAWISGQDVPMDQNNLEDDPTLKKREEILDDIDHILSDSGYSLFCENYYDDFFLVKNRHNQTIKTFHDYELLSRYNSLKKENKLTAEALLSTDVDFTNYLGALGYNIYFTDSDNNTIIIERDNKSVRSDMETFNHLKKYTDMYIKTMVETKLLEQQENQIKQERIQKEHLLETYQRDILAADTLRNNLFLNAAHSRTDVDLPEDADTTDNDVMDDDKNWE